MQTLRVIDPSSYGIYNHLAAHQVVNQIQAIRPAEVAQQLPELLQSNYCWYSLDNKTQALEFMTALLLAIDMHLPTQAHLNQAKVIDSLTKDMAERFYGWAVQRLAYRGSIEVVHIARPNFQANEVFRVPIEQHWDSRIDWVFHPIEQFSQHIPLPALKAMMLFREEEVRPDAYWVADKVETVIQRPRSLDPILCAQCGNWFAGIAMWL